MAGIEDMLGSLTGSGSSSGLDITQLQSMLGPAMEAINAQGGLSALLEKLQSGGLGDMVGSWLGQGQNVPLSADQLTNELGADTIGEIAGESGLSTEQVTDGLSSSLPEVVDQLSPNGQLPDTNDLQSMLGALLGK